MRREYFIVTIMFIRVVAYGLSISNKLMVSFLQANKLNTNKNNRIRLILVAFSYIVSVVSIYSFIFKQILYSIFIK